jgi:hypothetical protein
LHALGWCADRAHVWGRGRVLPAMRAWLASYSRSIKPG